MRRRSTHSYPRRSRVRSCDGTHAADRRPRRRHGVDRRALDAARSVHRRCRSWSPSCATWSSATSASRRSCRCRSSVATSGSAVLGSLLLGFGVVFLGTVRPAGAAGRDRRHVHRRLVVGALPDHVRRPAVRRRPGVAGPHGTPGREGVRMSAGAAPTESTDKPVEAARRHRGQARRDPRRHRRHHRGRRRRGQDRPGRRRRRCRRVAFLLGRRRGHKKSTIVEVRRI